MTHRLARPRGARALLGALAPSAAALALVGVAVPSASASVDGACPTMDDGVTVVVDFRDLGGGSHVRCAPGDPTTGIAALQGAGFSVTTSTQYPTVVCKIDGQPVAQDCTGMPPADAYWAYWHAERGGSWAYSQTGAGTYDPPVGSVEGWAFSVGGAKEPRQAPPPRPSAPPEPEPTSEPQPTRTTSTSTPRREPEPEPDPGSDPEPEPQRTADRAEPDGRGADPADAAPTAEPSPSAGPSPSAAASPSDAPQSLSPSPSAGAAVATAAGRPTTAEDPGSPWATVATLLLVTGLAAAAVVVRRRRGTAG